MSAIREMRTKLGYTQSEMASVLVVSRTKLNLMENGVRRVPGHVSEKLKMLEEVLQERDIEVDPIVAQAIEKERLEQKRLLERELALGQVQLERMKQDLSKMQAKRDQAIRGLSVLCNEKRVFDGVPSYTSKLESPFQSALGRYISTSPYRRELLQMQVDMLEARLVFIAGLLQNYLS